MELAFQTPTEHTDYARLHDFWQAGEELGFAAAFTFDHFLPLNPSSPYELRDGLPAGPQLEGWVILAALAAATKRMEVGALVSGVTYRHPLVFAKMAVSLDHVTNGRALFGIGAAWHEGEHYMYGFDFPPIGDRMAYLEETVEAFGMLCADDGRGVNYQGRFVKLTDAVFDPKPLRPGGRLPVLIGGGGERLRRITARHADWYNGFWAPWEWRQVNDGLDDLLRRYGRSPEDLKRTLLIFSELSGEQAAEDAIVKNIQAYRGGTIEETRSRMLVGSYDHMIGVLRSYAEAGVEQVIIMIRPSQTLEEFSRFAEAVMPAVAEA